MSGCHRSADSSALPSFIACGSSVDTVTVTEAWSRGSFAVSDSLILPTLYEPKDPASCDELGMDRYKPSRYSDSNTCDLTEIELPFSIYKDEKSEYVNIIKYDVSYEFIIDEVFCDEN